MNHLAQPYTDPLKTYEENLMAAFVQKPEKVPYYQKAYDALNLTGSGNPQLKWFWSWWGFAGGFAFLLYRKAYLAALVAFILGILMNVVPFGSLILMIVLGGISPYFVIKRYAMLKADIEQNHTEIEDRIQAMQAVGGTHPWVVWIAVIVYGFIFLGLVSMIMELS
ncbi:MAG: DUF2628 domain-containing protein [Thiotrichales bacterium]|nr:DUF2628 domain-containing protein [Thiotrichales bacterium]